MNINNSTPNLSNLTGATIALNNRTLSVQKRLGKYIQCYTVYEYNILLKVLKSTTLKDPPPPKNPYSHLTLI